MKILAMCITWNRPLLLGRSIHCFLQQTDSSGKMLILDDAGQYNSQKHENWTLVSVDKRYGSMGEKRNAVIELALKRYPNIEGFMLWDDDDCYFPHTIASVSAALEIKCWAQPRLALELAKDGRSLERTETVGIHGYPRDIAYGGCWAWRIETFIELGKFPVTNHSEDLKVSRPCQSRFGDSADSSPNEPWYYYNRLNNSISKEGKGFYAIRGSQKIEKVEEIPIGWNGPNIFDLPIKPGIQPRPW